MPSPRLLHGATISAPAVFVVCVAIAGIAFDSYLQYVFGLCLVAILVGVALVPLVGLARIVMLATGAMMGIGAYVSSLLIIKAGMPYGWALLLAAVAGGVAGLLLGLPAIRFRGHHLAMVTLVFQSLGIIVIREWKSMTGGAEGIRVPAAMMFGYTFRSDESNLIFLGLFSALSVLLITVVVRGSFGKVLRAIASTEVGSEAFGVNLGAYKVAAFVVSCTFLAVAGAILAPRLRIIDPDSFGIMQSINALAYPIVGGVTSIWGGLLGGGLLRALPEALRAFQDYAELIYAGLAVLTILLLPGGLVSGVESVANRLGWRRELDVSERGGNLDERVVLASRMTAAPNRTSVENQSYALQVTEVSKNYGSLAAVSNVSVSVPMGKIHGLIGPNGAGKTTLFNVISGFIEPDKGTVRLFGTESVGIAARDRVHLGITRTFQHVAIYDQLSLLDNVVIGLGENGVFRALWGCAEDALLARNYRRREDAAKAALNIVGLYPKRMSRAGALALGDQRRLEIARAIASRPKLLLLDEPVSGVAIEEERRLKELLHTLNSEWSLTMVLIEHNIRFVVDCCDTLSVMHEGEIVVEGRSDEVIARKDVQQIYFGKA